MKTNPLTVVSARSLTRSLPLLGALLWLASALPAASTSLHIAPTGNDTEGLQTFRLEWDAVSNATYRVQSASDLTSAVAWKTVDVATPANGAAILEIKGRSIPENSVEFFRLVLPQPEIFSVEPAVFAPGVAVDAFVIGQCFESNDVVRVDGVALSGVIHLSNNMLQGPLPTLSVGSHVVELVRGGVVRSSFTVMCADAFANPELVLQGPPGEPPASPQASYRTRKSMSEYNRSAASDGTFVIQDGKKGLNAVNVKLARMTGGVVPNIVWDNRFTGEFDYNVAPASGELVSSTTDLAILGRGLNFVWARTYRSRPGVGLQITIKCWTHSYDVAVAQTAAGIAVADGTGRLDTFKLQTNGVYTCPEFFSEGTLTGGVFRLTFADTGYWEFKPLTASADAGKLAQIVDRNGNVISLHYDGAGRLTEVVDDLDRTNTVAYNTAGQLASVTDFSGRTVTYAYYALGETGGSPGDLKSVTSPPVTGTPNGNDFPLGKTTTYTYSTGYLDDRENHLLLSVADALGQITYQHVYQHNQTDFEFLRCISVQHWTNPPTMFSYLPQMPTPANRFATMRCIVNDSVGNVTELYFDARNRRITMEDFTGRAAPGVPVTATVNRPINKLRSSDPDSYETQWAWNNDSLCISTKEPSHVEIPNLRFVYQSDFDPATPARKRADLRVVRELASEPVDSDGDFVSDATERAWRYDYDPRFGSGSGGLPDEFRESPSGGKGGGGNIGGGNGGLPFPHGPRESPSKMQVGGNGVAINTKGHGAQAGRANKVNQPAMEQCDNGVGNNGDNFVISITDPRGNVTTGSYDPNGNLTEVIKKHISNVKYESFAYNPHGQLTTITNAADANGFRRVDTFSYYTNGPQLGLVEVMVSSALAGGLALTTAFEYDARGNLTRYVDPRTNDWLYTYNALDQCVRARSPVNVSARCATDFAYDANDNLVQSATEVRDESDALLGSKVVVRGWDAMHRLTRSVRAVDATHSLTNDFVYDGNGQCVQMLGGDAVSGADPHQTVTFQYDERGLLFREITAPGSADQSTTQCDYDANGNVTRVSEGLEGTPRITTLEYDGFASGGRGFYCLPEVGDDSSQIAGAARPVYAADHDREQTMYRPRVWQLMAGQEQQPMRLSKITDPMGNVTTFNFDPCDNLRVVREFGETTDVPGTNGNVRLAETRYQYDALNRRIRAANPFFDPLTQAPIGDGESTTTFAYAPNGRCTSVTDDLGHTTTFAYDTAGRVYSVSVPGGKSVTACLRDQAGNVTSVVQTDTPDLGGPPQVFARTNVYDSLNRMVRTTDNVGNTNRYAYDSLNRVTAQFNPREYTRTFAYDLLDRCTLTVTDLDGDGIASLTADTTSTATWSSSSARMLSTTDSHDNITSYGYDSLGRCTSVTNADGTRHMFAWNPHSDLVSEQDANGTVTFHTYDLNDRSIANQYMPGAGVSATTTFEQFAYDGGSRLVAAINNGSVSTFAYDSLGNRTRDAAGAFAAVSTFDSVGNRLTLTYPGGRVATCAYDVLDQVASVSSSTSGLPPTTLATFAYAGPGRIARTTRANGVRTDVDWNGLVSPPNAPGDFGWQQISRVNHTRVGDSFLVDERTFQHDRNQNTSSRVRTPDSIRPGDHITTLTYDPADRLVDSIVTSNSTVVGFATYGLDRMGNRTNINRPFCAGNYLLDFASPPADFQMNQYTATPCDTRTYDANGNLTSASPSPASSVNYAYDCLDRLVAVNNSGVPVANYAYDALGRRISKSVFSGGLPPVTTEFLYDGGHMIEERGGGGVLATVFHGWDGDDGTGPVIAMRRAEQDYYFHTDDLGNTVALVDASGQPVEFYDYEDYGAVTFLTSDGVPTSTQESAVGNPFLFHGMEWDGETGLYRLPIEGTPKTPTYMDPQTGRAIRGKLKDIKDTGMGFAAVRGKVKSVKDWGNGRGLAGNNPWSGNSPDAMKKGTVKFFNDAKGFGRMSGGGGSGGSLKASDGKKHFDVTAK